MKRHFCFLFCLLCMTATLSFGMAEMMQGIYATIDGGNADRVHLRAEPSYNSASRGLYFTGTEVFCETDPTQEWTRVVIGSQVGYMKSEYLRWGDDRRNVQPKQPLGTVQAQSWVNVRSGPSTDDQINGKLYDGDTATILGETASHWYYVVCDSCTGYMKTDYVRLSQSGGATGGSPTTQPIPSQIVPWQPGSSQLVPPLNVTETIDPGDSLEAYITASNCSVTLIPTDSDVVTCQYNANAIVFTNEIARGTQMLTFESRGQTTSSAAVMLYIPRNVYYQIYLDVNNGEGSVAGGFGCYRIVNGNNARFSLTLAAEELYGYSIGLTNSECIMGISEVAQNYSIMVDRIANSTIGAAYDMPAYQAGAASYSYTKGNGGAQIKATGIRNSNLEFIYVR